MESKITTLNENYISKNRCTGELEHPPYPEIKADNAAILLKSLSQDGTIFHGNSKVLSTPKGKILGCLLHDEVNLGVSSRALGEVDKKTGIVTDFELITFDVVSDPSCHSSFVSGILESKEWICNNNGIYEQVYEKFEDKLAKLPKLHLDKYLRESIITFMRSLNK